jgi:hypothetical protein
MFNVIYSDVDVFWLDNPIPLFSGDFDIWVQTEARGRIYCAGFMAIKCNNKTIQLMQAWETELNRTLQTNQPAFNILVRKANLNISLLNESIITSGPDFDKMSTDNRNKVVVIHASYYYGHDDKMTALRKWNLWKNMSTDQDMTQ